jgi:hypothetical protein
VNGEMVATRYWPPFFFQFEPQESGPVEITARAWDKAGNSATSLPVAAESVIVQTPVADEDFDDGVDGWHYMGTGDPVTSVTPLAGEIVLGGFSHQDLVKTYDLSNIPHKFLLVTFDFYSMDDWDCIEADMEQDAFRILADGMTRFSACFNQMHGSHVDGNTEYLDRILREDIYPDWPAPLRPPVTLCFPHTGDQLVLELISNLDQGSENESWAIDNLKILALDVGTPGLEHVQLILNDVTSDYHQDCQITGTCP